jgi:hypothetical protein
MLNVYLIRIRYIPSRKKHPFKGLSVKCFPLTLNLATRLRLACTLCSSLSLFIFPASFVKLAIPLTCSSAQIKFQYLVHVLLTPRAQLLVLIWLPDLDLKHHPELMC